MAIECAFAEAGEMLAASQHVGGAQAGEKLARIGHGLARIGGNGGEVITLREASKARSRTGAKSRLKPRARQFSPISWPCLRKSLRAPVAKTSAAAGVGPKSIAEAIDLAAFKIDAGKERRGDAVLAIAQEAEGLLGSFYISREENYASGLEAGEQGAEVRS